ncbi:MAG TPA: TIGR03619 family F420-dependent LLM class oxidoreductase [Dehalococcoidia bacterium]|nr:TIGR03619 family F420-dependent LLM class oxidoreductase [Dehalococcoidia bacterium]
MKIGFNVPNLGPAASPENIIKIAQKAEELGYDSIWTTERLLVPVNPLSGYGGMAGVPIPWQYKVQFDPLDTLSVVAAVTKRPRLGTSVLDLPFYNAALLARRLTTIDVFSGGRLTVGMGIGWCPEEFDAVGVSMRQRGARATEALQMFKAIWTKDPVEFKGKIWNIPPSHIELKPVQKPHPPVLMAAFAPAAMKRIATMADGWLPVGLPVPAMTQMWQGIRGMAKEAGRDPSKLQLIVRANFSISPEPGPEGRFIFTGSEEQIKQDIADVGEMGADEVHFDPTTGAQGETAEGWFESIERIRELAG